MVQCATVGCNNKITNPGVEGSDIIHSFCCAQPGQTGLFTQSCCDLVVPWPHTGVSFQVLLPAGGVM